MEFLSEEWCSEVVARAAAGTALLGDVTVEIQLTGAPRGRGRITMVIRDGRMVTLAPQADKDAELKLKSSHEDALAMLVGERDPNVAFMTGDLKTDGPTGPLLDLLAAWNTPGVQLARGELAELAGDSGNPQA